MIIVRGIPIYWGIETKPLDRSFITRSTLHEVLPPYRHSVRAFRIRVSYRRWLHVGTFFYEREIGRYGLNATPSDINQWRGGSSAVQEEDVYDDDSALVAIRPVREVGSDRPAGGDDDEEWGTLQGFEPLGTGSGLDPGADAATG